MTGVYSWCGSRGRFPAQVGQTENEKYQVGLFPASGGGSARIDGGDRTIVLGEVVGLGTAGQDADPLIFCQGSIRALEDGLPGSPRH
jgi:hypothetical protein